MADTLHESATTPPGVEVAGDLRVNAAMFGPSGEEEFGVDLRRWVRDKNDGALKPTRRGVRMDRLEWIAFVTEVNALDDYVAERHAQLRPMPIDDEVEKAR